MPPTVTDCWPFDQPVVLSAPVSSSDLTTMLWAAAGFDARVGSVLAALTTSAAPPATSEEAKLVPAIPSEYSLGWVPWLVELVSVGLLPPFWPP